MLGVFGLGRSAARAAKQNMAQATAASTLDRERQVEPNGDPRMLLDAIAAALLRLIHALEKCEQAVKVQLWWMRGTWRGRASLHGAAAASAPQTRPVQYRGRLLLD